MMGLETRAASDGKGGSSGKEDRKVPETPFGATAFLVALLAAVPVVFFDDLEMLLEPFAVAGAPTALLIVAIFAFVWLLPGVGLLGAFSPQPAREGLLAGGFAAALLAREFLRLGMAEPGLWFLLGILFLVFGSLTVGLGALAGVLANAAQGGPRVGVGRAGPVVAIVCGVLVPLAGFPFAVPGDPIRPAAFLLGFALAAGGAWGLWRASLRVS